MAWAKNGTPNTLSSLGDVLTISDLTAKKFNTILIHDIISTNSPTDVITIDNNTNTDYSIRYSSNGAADGTLVSQSNMQVNGWDGDGFKVIYSVNIDSEEKLFIYFSTDQGSTTGAGAVSLRFEGVGKCDTTTNTGQYTRIDYTNTGTGDYASGTNISVFGTN